MVSSLSLLVNITHINPINTNINKNINMPMKITMKSTHPLGNGLYHLFLVIWEMVYGIVLRALCLLSVSITYINPINTNINKNINMPMKITYEFRHLGWSVHFFSEPKIQAAKPPAATVEAQGSVEMFNGTTQADVVQHFLAGTAKFQRKHRENQGKTNGKPRFTCGWEYIYNIYNTHIYINKL